MRNTRPLITEAKASKNVDLHALGDAINTSWGKASTNDNLDQEEWGGKAFRPITPYSVKASLKGNAVVLSFAMIVNFPDDRSIQIMSKDYEQESKKITADALKKIKANYKDQSKLTLGLKEIDSRTSVEFISALGVKRTAYFRRISTYELT